MLDDHEVDALRAIADRIRGYAEQPTYGAFPGGDPREFCPDEECCTAEEMERYTADCAAWERGEGVDRGGPHLPLGAPSDVAPDVVVSGPEGGWQTVHYYGLGTYSYRDEDLMRLAQDLDDVIDRVRAAEVDHA